MKVTSVMMERAVDAYWEAHECDVDASIHAAVEAALGALPLELERQAAALTTLPPAHELIPELNARITSLQMKLEDVRKWASVADLRASDARSLRQILEGNAS